MSAVLHSFQIKLSAEQSAEIRREWKKVAGQDCAMLVIQPIGMTSPDGIIDVREPTLHCAVCDALLAKGINQTLIWHKEERP